jgi:hypothetical protein
MNLNTRWMTTKYIIAADNLPHPNVTEGNFIEL